MRVHPFPHVDTSLETHSIRQSHRMDRVANSSLIPEFDNCVRSIPSRSIFTAWFTAHLFLLPLFLLVLYIGFLKWRKPNSSASGGLSHSDVFTLNMVAMEMASVIGSCVTLCGYFTSNVLALRVGGNTVYTILTGQVLFHSLTCVERYLAVVRPVTYLGLRGEGGVTVRNTCIALVWIFCVVYTLPGSILNEPVIYGVCSFVLSITSLPVVAYCSVFVLWVLIRPKPGERGGDRQLIDQSKRATVYTMAAILGALLLRTVAYVLFGCINFLFWRKVDGCVTVTASLWAALPSSLVLPLLFLHRAGKLLK